MGKLDTDGDGYGNTCDCDLSNDDFCGGSDFPILISGFNKLGATFQCDAADMKEGFVGQPDYSMFIFGVNESLGSSGLVR